MTRGSREWAVRASLAGVLVLGIVLWGGCRSGGQGDDRWPGLEAPVAAEDLLDAPGLPDPAFDPSPSSLERDAAAGEAPEEVLEGPAAPEEETYLPVETFDTADTFETAGESELDPSFLEDALAEHGTWIETEGLWCWQPRVAVTNRGWRPYLDGGSWVYTDLGWYWHSDYLWGWAPFHYGRWFYHPVFGWLWCPGEEWAPAWVEWRIADDCYGWAPLPPEATYEYAVGYWEDDCPYTMTEEVYVFVRREYILARWPRRYCYPTSRNADLCRIAPVLRRSHVVKEGRVHHRGPDPDQVAAVSWKPLRKVRVVDGRAPHGRSIPAGVLKDDRLEVFRPRIARAGGRGGRPEAGSPPRVTRTVSPGTTRTPARGADRTSNAPRREVPAAESAARKATAEVSRRAGQPEPQRAPARSLGGARAAAGAEPRDGRAAPALVRAGAGAPGAPRAPGRQIEERTLLRAVEPRRESPGAHSRAEAVARGEEARRQERQREEERRSVREQQFQEGRHRQEEETSRRTDATRRVSEEIFREAQESRRQAEARAAREQEQRREEERRRAEQEAQRERHRQEQEARRQAEESRRQAQEAHRQAQEAQRQAEARAREEAARREQEQRRAEQEAQRERHRQEQEARRQAEESRREEQRRQADERRQAEERRRADDRRREENQGRRHR